MNLNEETWLYLAILKGLVEKFKNWQERKKRQGWKQDNSS